MTHPSKIVLRKKHFSDWKFVKLFFIAHFFFSFPRDSVVWGPTAWPENQLLTAAPRAKSFNSSCRRQFLLRRISNRSNTQSWTSPSNPSNCWNHIAVVTKSTSSGKAARASFSRRRRAFVESSQRSFVAEGCCHHHKPTCKKHFRKEVGEGIIILLWVVFVKISSSSA